MIKDRWFMAASADAEDWHRAGSTRDEAVALGGAEYGHLSSFFIAKAHKPPVTSVAKPRAEDVWQQATEQAELHEAAVEYLVDAITKEDEDRFDAFWREWAATIVDRCPACCLDESDTEEIRVATVATEKAPQ